MRILVIIAGLLLSASVAVGSEEDEKFFESKVRPVLVERCYRCHSGTKTSGGLSLETKAGWTTGGDSGPAIVPGKPEESLLVKAIGHKDEFLAMPPADDGGKLPDSEIAALTEWVKRGAFDPRTTDAKIAGMDAAEARSWWAFQPVRQPPLPDVKHRDGVVQNDVDLFIQAKLEAADIGPAPMADRRTLIRRATYDLTGLPPTPAEVEAFANDPDPQAIARVIDRLLDSPQYGERWARHWLDVVRYADSLDARGYGGGGDIAEAWKYRDWVVSSLNADLPYNEFIRRQMAGDLLARQGSTYDPRKVIATGVYAIGHWGNGDSDKLKVHTDIVDDQIDLTTRAFLGITLSCARCHDHKFDPLTTRDYYAMSGFFFSSRVLDRFNPPTAGETPMRIPLLSPEQQESVARKRERIAEIDRQLQDSLVVLDKVEKDVRGIAGLYARKGADDTPSFVANLTDAELEVLTFRLPPKSVALHPGPTVPITAVWISPIAGRVRVELKLQDADPVCGDGAAWELRSGTTVVGSGQFENGRDSAFTAESVEVEEGGLLRLVILPRGSHVCDTTLTEFTISTSDRRWSFSESMLAHFEQPEAVWLVGRGDAARLRQDDESVAALTAEKARLLAEIPETPLAVGMVDGGIPGTPWEGFRNGKIHKRGRYDQLGDEVPRGFPAILSNNSPKIDSGSGRLALAEWVTSSDNPLVARVIVNRVWQQHFGEGLVRTPNNFGKLGEQPTHPELLDWLADRFVRDGWRLKSLHRLILSSAAYQRAVADCPTDPENRLLSHQARRRLSAEEIRDSLLAAAGRLDRTLGGPPIRDVMANRRTLYIATIRSEKSNFQTLFDGANPETIVEARTESTVAPQALWLLNSEFALAQMAALSQRVAERRGDLSAKLNWLCRELFQRDANDVEQRIAEHWVADAKSAADWEALCQIFLCTNEFAYVD